MLDERPLARVKLILTSREPPAVGTSNRVRVHALRGLTKTEAKHVLDASSGTNNKPPHLPRTDDDIEPLYLEHLLAIDQEADSTSSVDTLANIVEARLQALFPAQRRLLQAIAVTGGGTVSEMGSSLNVRRTSSTPFKHSSTSAS